MTDLLERVLEMPTRQRVLLLVGTVGMLFFLYANFIYWPRSATIAEKQENLDAMIASRDAKAKLVANLAKAKEEVADLRAALNEAVAQLPDGKEIPDLLSNISAVGRDSGLDIAQFRQRPEVYREFYAEVPVEILVRGTYFQVEEFFNQVSQLTRIVNVADIGITAPATITDDNIRLETSCSATTFRFLDEEERERIAKEREKESKR
jgi:type IV pilus assembly protein PilO